MSSVGEYKTVEDVISDLNIMIVEAPRIINYCVTLFDFSKCCRRT